MSSKPFPEAIPTTVGWAHPLTGEKLDCTSGLANPVDFFKPNARGKSFLDPEGETEFLIQTQTTGARTRFAIHTLRDDIVGVEWDFDDGTDPLETTGLSCMKVFPIVPEERAYDVVATVAYDEGEGTEELEVTVTVPATPVAVESLSILGDLSVLQQRSSQLTLQATFLGGAFLNVTADSWASSSEEIATVSAGGLVTAVAEGTANITATYQGKSVVVMFEVFVGGAA